MNKLAVGIVVLGLVAGGAFFASGGGLGGAVPTSKAAEKSPTAAPVKMADRVVAEGKVVPVRNATLSLATGGLVAEVLVAEGDDVTANQVLLRLDSTRQGMAVQQAEAGLRRAQAHLEEVRAGSRPQEVEAAKAAVESAQAQLERVTQSARPEEIAAAEASVAQAKAQLDKVRQGPDKDLVVAAQSELAKLKAGPTAEEIRGAELAIEQAKATLWSAQTERDGQCNPSYPRYLCDAGNSRAMAAETALLNAQNNLAKLKVGARAEDVAAAQARFDQLQQGPKAADVANARAQIDQAQAKLDQLRASARPADVAAAQAEVRRAQAQLKLLQDGARPETIAAAEADVAAAEATLKQARATLNELELKAPFAGNLATLDVKVGENLTPGTPVARVADTSAWQIETTDLTELSAVKVREGQRATVTFDAIPDLEVPGTVSRVKALGESKRGDIVYTVVVKPDQQDARLRWNMTTSVSIEPK